MHMCRGHQKMEPDQDEQNFLGGFGLDEQLLLEHTGAMLVPDLQCSYITGFQPKKICLEMVVEISASQFFFPWLVMSCQISWMSC